MLYRFILKLIRLYKMVNFTEQGDLVISHAGSKIRLTNKGDIIVNAKRHTVHHRDLFFDGCEEEFITKAINENSKSKRHLEKYVMGKTRVSEFNVPKCKIKEKVKDGNGN
jgi:phage gp45-like